MKAIKLEFVHGKHKYEVNHDILLILILSYFLSLKSLSIQTLAFKYFSTNKVPF